MDGVLLLNVTSEAIRIISLQRAIVLVLQNKAEIIEASKSEIRSVSVSIPKPEVIRLKYYVKIPYRSRIPVSNRAVLARDNHKCGYCGIKATTVDHVVPRCKGGTHTWDNVIASCIKCNTKKGSKTLEALGWSISKKLESPPTKTWIIIGNADYVSRWGNYI